MPTIKLLASSNNNVWDGKVVIEKGILGLIIIEHNISDVTSRLKVQ